MTGIRLVVDSRAMRSVDDVHDLVERAVALVPGAEPYERDMEGMFYALSCVLLRPVRVEVYELDQLYANLGEEDAEAVVNVFIDAATDLGEDFQLVYLP